MDKLLQIREMLAKLAELNKDELTSLGQLIVEVSNEYDEAAVTPDTIAIINELADAADTVIARHAEIDAEAIANEEARAAARERIAKLNGSDEEPETETPEGETPEGETPEVEAGAEQPEPVTAAGAKPVGSSPSRMAQHATPPAASPEADGAHRGRSSLIATGRGMGPRSGEVISDRRSLGEVMTKTLERMSPRDRAQGTVIIASAEWAYPEDRTFGADPASNEAIVAAACHPSALVATGGVCAPVNVDYSLETWAVADRPLRDGLPAFQASRGGLTYRQPPTVAALAGATEIWTEATDANPDGATKPVLAISCASPETVYVDAVPTRLGFGNMMGQFDPETIAANTDLSLAAAARIAEVNLLSQIAAASILDITRAADLGAARDFFACVDSVVAQYRDVNRLSDNQMLTIVLPRWLKDYIRMDRVRELAHDSQGVDPFNIPDAWIDDSLALRKVKAIWTLEGLPATGSGGATFPTQNFVLPTTAAALPSFPTKTVWHIFPEGGVQFLDGGRLDLGVVRDSTLDATNDYETFVETFEAIANRTYSGGIWQVVQSLCANGGSAATVAVTGTCS